VASLEELAGRLEGMAASLAGQDATRACIGTLILHAMTLQAMEEENRALPSLERALTLAEPEGYVHTFVREGEPMRRLLRKAAQQGIVVSYVGKLLSALETGPAGIPAQPMGSAAEMIEPLSDRELQVLRLLTTPMTSTEIAEELFIAPSTVRSHIKNIYSKLDVHRRAESVQRAQELGLL
jgi:LuxR family maltose regulon positive regulatory protein